MTYKTGYFMKANEGVYGVVRSALAPTCELVTLDGGKDTVEAVRDLDFLVAGKVNRAMIEAAPRLKLIMTPGVGYDGVDLDAAASRSIPVACTVCGNVDEVAEHTLLLMLAVSRRLIEIDAALRAGRWMMWDRRLQSFNLAGKSLGLIGYGRIGREVARRAATFKMNVHFHDPEYSGTADYLALDDLLGSMDYVSLHVPLSASTRGLLSAQRIAAMKPGAVLINTSRGEVVDERALIEALRSGALAGAGLDVFDKEPPAGDNPLLTMSNVVVTPHVASGTRDGLRVKAAQYAENIRRVLAGEELIDCVLAPQAVRS